MKVLVANRGEIAVRILRACREMGLPSVAIFSDVDNAGMHVRCADEAIPVGKANGYLDIQAVIEAARRSGADAIHPGYGFLAENTAFARAVESAGLIFIGPCPETIALTGDKLAARQAAREANLPVLPGSDDPLPREVPAELAACVQYPVLIKAIAGGGGRGIRLAVCADDLRPMIEAARAEAHAAFGDDTVFLESLVQQARHIEVQILGDGNGKVISLGERECSLQRRRQKLVEEAPASGLSAGLRKQIWEAALRLGNHLNYRSLGTVEFLLDKDGNFFFIEINPRIQVEHPVTEMVTGIDLVKEQLRLAMGEPLRLTQKQVVQRGAAIEARVLAEDSEQGFMPSIGQIVHLKESGGPGVRVDSHLYTGMQVTTDYDSLLAKVIVWEDDRQAAIKRLHRALQEFQISGVATDLQFLQQIISSPGFIDGKVDTTYLENFTPQADECGQVLESEIALAAAIFAHRKKEQQNTNHSNHSSANSPWRMMAWQEQMHGNL